MSDRKGYYLKRPGRATAPAAIVSVVVCRDHDRELDDTPASAVATLGEVYVTACRRSRDHWAARERLRFVDANSFWSWLDNWSHNGRKTYVVSPTASDALTLLGFWGMVDTAGARWAKRGKQSGAAPPESSGFAGYTFARFVTKGAPDIVEYTFAGRTLCWLSVRNYFTADAATLIKPRTTLPAMPRRGRAADAARPMDRWEAESDSWLEVFATLADWWRGLDAGGWRPTAASMADGFMRSRMVAPIPCPHNHDGAKRIERLASHRGRVSCWYFGTALTPDADPDHTALAPVGPFGTIQGPLFHLDVASMYPYLLTVTPMPVKLLSVKSNPSVQRARDLCHSNVCTAAVRLDTPDAEYPHRGKNDINYPTGKFTAYLSGCELRRALDDGIVSAVYELVVYQPGFPFKAAAEELLQMRMSAKGTDDKAWEMFVKLLANSMTGRFAQRKSRWVERPNAVAVKRWGEWPRINHSTGERRYFQAKAGLVWEKMHDADGVGTMTACYGHLTAACSMMMRGIRAKCPPMTVVSQDTDGVWVTLAGLQALLAQGTQFKDEPGGLRVTDSVNHARFWSAKHYLRDGRWTLSGLHQPVPHADGFEFLDTVTTNAIRATPLCPPLALCDTRRAVTLNVLPSAGSVGRDGWFVPVRLPAGSGPTPAQQYSQQAEPDDAGEDDKQRLRPTLFDRGEDAEKPLRRVA